MHIRPFGSERFLVDLGQGDILAEAGDVLVIGRPKGLRSPTHHLDDPALWLEFDHRVHRSRRLLQEATTALPWQDVYTFSYRPKSRERLPTGSPGDPLRYFLVRNDLDLLLLHIWIRCRGRAELKIGLVPLSWRQPDVVAHIMVEAVAGLFFFAQGSDCKSLTVVIRSLDEPRELARVFDRGYFKAWRRKMGWPRTLQDVWRPA